jgi:hypothetical protein
VAAAKKGTTAASLREAAVTALGTEVTEEEINAKMAEILVSEHGYLVRNIGVMGRIEEIAMTKLGIVSTLAKVGADKLETWGI